MNTIYWLIALWIVIGFIVAIAFGVASSRGANDVNAIRTVKRHGGVRRQAVSHAADVTRMRSFSRSNRKVA